MATNVELHAPLTCLFWNTGRRDLDELVARLAADIAVDVVVLAENGADVSSPSEFSEKVEAVLASGVVKAIVLSLLSRSRPPEADKGGATP